MPGVPLDVMDKFKALFKRKKASPATSGTASTHTAPIDPTGTGVAAPKAGQTAQDTTAAPSSSNPTAAAAGGVPATPAIANKPVTPPAPHATEAIPQVGSVDATKAPTSTTV